MTKWPDGFLGLTPGGPKAVWDVPGLAGVMRCTQQMRMQQSRASGAVLCRDIAVFFGLAIYLA